MSHGADHHPRIPCLRGHELPWLPVVPWRPPDRGHVSAATGRAGIQGRKQTLPPVRSWLQRKCGSVTSSAMAAGVRGHLAGLSPMMARWGGTGAGPCTSCTAVRQSISPSVRPRPSPASSRFCSPNHHPQPEPRLHWPGSLLPPPLWSPGRWPSCTSSQQPEGFF